MKPFSYRAVKMDPALPFEFGWEAEYHPREAGALLDHYEPLGSGWDAVSGADKTGWLQRSIDSRGLGDREALLRRAPGAPEFLPALAYRDDTGNIEVRRGPFSSFAEARENLRAVSALLGTGSLQLTISQPTERFFAQGVDAQLGWLCFFSELDVLERLARGQEWRRRGYKGELTRNFLHAFLGPLNRRRRKMLAEFLRENAVGNLWGQEDLFWAGRKDKSFKFVGSTAYRPDIAGPARVCFEVRDAHRDLDLLEERALRVLHYWNRDISAFAAFSSLPAFDNESDFAPLPISVRERLTELFPCRAPEALRPFASSLLMHEVYRNFAYPLRAWGAWLETLGVDGEELRAHQEKYGKALEQAVSLSDTAEARQIVQNALSLFAAESPLYPAFRRKEEELYRGE